MSFLKDVISANEEIFRLIKSSQTGLDEYLHQDETKIGAGGDRSLVIDKLAEDIFVKFLQKYGKIISEESGEIGSGDFCVVLDPIDGSSNLAANFPYYGTSVCLKKDEKALISVVTNLCSGEYFFKDETGAFSANFISKTRPEPLGLDTKTKNIGILEKSYCNLPLIEKIWSLKIKMRSPGAMALSLAYAHRVSFVVFNGMPREYDIIAGLHICEDLHVHIDDDLIIVSKHADVFSSLQRLLL